MRGIRSIHGPAQADRASKVSRPGSSGHRLSVSRRFRVLTLLAAALALSAGACHRQTDSGRDVSVEESITPQPVRTGDVTVSIRLADASGRPLSRARVQVEGDMNHPGMAPVFSDALETAPGSYQAPFTFTMGGDWVVLAHITVADGRRVERQWDVKGVESR